MGLGDMMGAAQNALGGEFDMGAKMEELGVDPSMLEGMGVDAAKSFIEEKGFDLSILESLGLNFEDLLAKFMGGGE